METTNVKKIRQDLNLLKELESKNKEIKSKEKEIKELKKAMEKYESKIKKYEIQIFSEDIYKYNNYGDITGMYPDIASDKFLNKNKIIFSGGNYYNYNHGVYRCIHIEDLRNSIRNDLLSFKDPYINSSIENILKMVSIKSHVKPNIINNSGHINFRNGFLNVDTFELLNHSEDVYNTLQLKCNYKKSGSDINNTTFMKFLKDSVKSDSLIYYIQQILGYLFSNYTEAQKFFVLKGEPQTGKSTFLNIIRSFCDSEFISSVDLKNLSRPEFVARLHGKLLNICGDIGQNYIDDSSLLLQLFGEDEIEAKPLYSNPFSFLNKARCVFSTNSLPNVNDKSGAFLRRCVIIPFNNVISEEKKDTTLLKRIVENELDIIAYWAIEGLRILKNNNFKFSDCKEIRVELDNYKMENNNIEKFITDYCHIDHRDSKIFITKKEFNEIYKMWCKEDNRNVLSSKHIHDTFTKYNLKESRSHLHKSRYLCNVAWKSIVLDDFEHDYTMKYTKSIESSVLNLKEIEQNSISKIENFYKQKIVFFQDVNRCGLNNEQSKHVCDILSDLYFEQDTTFMNEYNKRVLEKPDRELIPEILLKLYKNKIDTDILPISVSNTFIINS